MKLLKTTARRLLGSGKLRTGPLTRRRIEMTEATVQTSSDPRFFVEHCKFSNEECASISPIFVENYPFSKKECASISEMFVGNC